MAFISYTPKRRLVGGSDGKLHFSISSHDVDLKEDVTHHEPLDGSDGETVFYGERDILKMTASLVHKNEIDKWREFKSSTAAGETFTCDEFGSESSPVNPLVYKRDPNGYREKRVSNFYFDIVLTFSRKPY